MECLSLPFPASAPPLTRCLLSAGGCDRASWPHYFDALLARLCSRTPPGPICCRIMYTPTHTPKDPDSSRLIAHCFQIRLPSPPPPGLQLIPSIKHPYVDPKLSDTGMSIYNPFLCPQDWFKSSLSLQTSNTYSLAISSPSSFINRA